MAYETKCDYIVNAGYSLAPMNPIAGFDTLGSAIKYAEEVLTGAKCPFVVEVVYMPEDDEDINLVLYKNERGGRHPCIFVAAEEIIKIKIQKEVSK